MAEIFVGEVAVGIVPDARNFNTELRKQLIPSADNIGREFGSKLGRGIQEGVRVSIEKIKADLKQEFNVNVGADTAKASAEIDKTRAEQEARPVRLKVDVDQSSIRNLGARLSRSIRGAVKTGAGNLASGGAAGLGLFAGSSAALSIAGPLGAATAALGSFALIAVPEITKVDAALQKTGKSAQTAWKQLTPQERDIGRAFKGVESAFHSIQKEVAPDVDAIVSLGAGFIKDVLPDLALFARVGASVIRSFITPLDVWIKSKSFGILTNEFAQFGTAAGAVVGPALVQILKAFAQLFVQLLPSGLQILKVLLPLIVMLVQDLTPGIVITAQVAANVLKWLQANHLLIPALAATLAIVVVLTGASGLGGIIAATILVGLTISFLATHWRQIWHGMLSVISDVWNWIKSHWPLLTIILAGPVGAAAVLIIKHWHDIESVARTVWNAVVGIVRGAMNVARGLIRDWWIVISDIFGFIIHGAANAFGWIPGLGGKLHSAASAFDSFRNRVNGALSGINGRTVDVGIQFSLGAPGHRRAAGGYIPFGSGPTADDVPIWASRGEYVVKAAAVAKYGTHMMNMINAGRFASGGSVGLTVRPNLPSASQIDANIGPTLQRLAIQFAETAVAAAGAGGSGFGGHGVTPTGPIQAYAKSLVGRIWPGLGQWLAFADIVARESGWNTFATNPSSGAYGIPQALPGRKMASAGADWRTNPFTQVRWMVGYIHDRWIDPIRADFNERNAHWYDNGGKWYPGEWGFNNLSQPEAVLSPSQWDAIYSAAKGGDGSTTYVAHFDGLTGQVIEAHVRQAFRMMDLQTGLSQRAGRRR